MELDLTENITSLKGIGESRAKLFKKLGISTLYDLLYYFPIAYEDRRNRKYISDINDGDKVLVTARISSHPSVSKIKKGFSVCKFYISDETGRSIVTFFNQSFVVQKLVPGLVYAFYGKFTKKNGRIEITNPIFEAPEENRHIGRLVPVYGLTNGLSRNVIMQTIESALKSSGFLKEIFSSHLRSEYNLCDINFAIENIHFPRDEKSLEIARKRLVFEELFVFELALFYKRGSASVKKCEAFKNIPADFRDKLPYDLTDAQERVIKEISQDLLKNRPMNRILQGDVGSGKTVVAAFALYVAYKNGFQSVLMAPTEILAKQHGETIKKFIPDASIKVICGSTTAKEKREIKESTKNHEVDILIGTHAVLEDDMMFNRLGLVITDEQHRFGVSQRATLETKGKSPHTLVMSATPIPRTLSLVLYGDLDISVLDGMPPGRQKTETFCISPKIRERMYVFIEKNAAEGGQAYIVCPLVEEGENSPDLTSVINYAEKLSERFEGLKIELLHGRLKGREKDEIMKRFLNKETDILVSTTVIEVGVDVPNSNIMVIENAERFGLSQLHQLRGRVGRGNRKSYCILVCESLNDISRSRMEIMCKTNDGFKIAEKDLELRGPGEFFGTRQHGASPFKTADLIKDARLIALANKGAKQLLSEDAGLSKEENADLRNRMDKMLKDLSITFN